MMCTLAGLVLKARTARIFHAGDSRVRRLSNADFGPMTKYRRLMLPGGDDVLVHAIGMTEGSSLTTARSPSTPLAYMRRFPPRSGEAFEASHGCGYSVYWGHCDHRCRSGCGN